jgi:hypothetical protein
LIYKKNNVKKQLNKPEPIFQDAPVTAYYLWLPFLLTFCFGFAKFPRSLWRNYLEGNMVRNILQVWAM